MRRRTWAIALIVFTLPFLGGLSMAASRDGRESSALFDRILSDALQLVKDHYVRAVTPRELVYGAIRGMLETLDPDSRFLSPEERLRLRTESAGAFVGIGAEVKRVDDTLVVVGLLAGSPAEQAGINVGDHIIGIDDTAAGDFDHDTLAWPSPLLPQSPIRVKIKRPLHTETMNYTIYPSEIDLPSVRGARMVSGETGYVRIDRFTERSGDELKAAVSDLMGEGMTGLILDVRDNPGGRVRGAVSVAELFLKKSQLIFTMKGRRKDSVRSFNATSDGPFCSLKLALLQNEHSASGAEVLAAALKYHRNAMLIGKHTLGKASVQILVELRDGSAMRITTAEYFTPDGISIHGTGVRPDLDADGPDAQLDQAIRQLELP